MQFPDHVENTTRELQDRSKATWDTTVEARLIELGGDLRDRQPDRRQVKVSMALKAERRYRSTRAINADQSQVGLYRRKALGSSKPSRRLKVNIYISGGNPGWSEDALRSIEQACLSP